MHINWLDWAIICIPVIAIIIVAINTQGHTKSVADFMAASRVAGRYLVCNAQGEAGFGAISAVAVFEMIYVAGFAMSWWGKISIPVGLFLGLSGFMIYRYRETRVMTLSQFFEIRYSKSFRIFSGFIFFLSGVVNYGIFPAVGARFFVYFCGFPDKIHLWGNTTFPTFGLLMILFLSVALFLTLAGGQLTIMVTDCIEGLLSGVFYLIVAFALLYMFSWDQISSAMMNVPEGKSLLNPFDTRGVKDFNLWYVLIGVFGSIYGYGSWQGGHAFRASAANPHEAKMGGILGSWRGFARGVMITLLGICAFTFLNHADFAFGAAQVNQSLSQIDSPQLQKQMRVPVALAYMLPFGIKGALASIMMFALLACDGSYMHSWGSIFVQDVVLPFRKKPFTPKQHLSALRWGIAGVAVFAFFFSLFYKPTEYILMFFALTGAIISGAGAVILGGLYWKKGTTQAAWWSMIVGSTLAVGSLILDQVPYARTTIQIEAPEALSVTVNGEAAERRGTAWESKYKFYGINDWQNCKIAAKYADVEDIKVIHFGIGKQLPPLKRQAEDAIEKPLTHELRMTPGDGYVAPLPEGALGRLYIMLRSLNGQIKYFIAMLVSVLLYVGISLLTCKEDFNMDKLLHRGQYAVKEILPDGTEVKHTAPVKEKFKWNKLLGFDKDFTLGDKILSGSVFFWSMLWFGLFIVISIWNIWYRWPLKWWATYWHIEAILVPMGIGVVTTVWFTWGGIRDLNRLFKALGTVKRDTHDDGSVSIYKEDTMPAPDIATPGATPDELNRPEPDTDPDADPEASAKPGPKP